MTCAVPGMLCCQACPAVPGKWCCAGQVYCRLVPLCFCCLGPVRPLIRMLCCAMARRKLGSNPDESRGGIQCAMPL